MYLSTIKDLFNNEIIAYNMSLRNDNQLFLQTFVKAFEKQKDMTGLIVHLFGASSHDTEYACPFAQKIEVEV